MSGADVSAIMEREPVYSIARERKTKRAQWLRFELELIQPHMAQKPVLRGEVIP